MGKGSGKGGDDSEETLAICCGGCCALYILIGLLTLIFSTCDDGECTDDSCWYGCDCHECEAGFMCDSYFTASCDSKPESCNPGTFALSGAASCDACSNGQYCDHDECSECVSCGPGRIPNADATGCTNCPAGTYDQGKNDCTPCQAGKWSTARSTHCTDCEAGRARGSSGHGCSECPAGRSSSRGSSRCNACESGQYADHGGSSSCYRCDSGQFSGNSGATTCTQCEAGRHASSGGANSCAACSTGQFSQPGQSTCTTCGPGHHVVGTTGCVECAEGQYQDRGSQASCIACESGKFKDSTGASTPCANCDSGQFSGNSGATTCTQCEAGRHAPSGGANSCAACSTGQFSQKGQSTCTTCGPGHHVVGTTGCVECAEGQYQDRGSQASCIACESGKFKDSTGASTPCDACSAGSFSRAGASGCAECAQGQYQDQQAQGSCIQCLPGKFTARTGLASCELCAAGSSSPPGASGCEACDIREFQYCDHAGCEACLTCATGRLANSGGTGCIDCASIDANSTVAADLGCSAVFVRHCPSDTRCASCSADVGCSGEQALSTGGLGASQEDQYCNDAGFCDACDNLLTGQCEFMGGDCCNSYALLACPSVVSSQHCDFCRGSLIGCDATLVLAVSWLAITGVLFSVWWYCQGLHKEYKFLEDGKIASCSSKAQMIGFAVLFIVPKVLFMNYAIAHCEIKLNSHQVVPQFESDWVYILCAVLTFVSIGGSVFMALVVPTPSNEHEPGDNFPWFYVENVTNEVYRPFLGKCYSAVFLLHGISIAAHVWIASRFSSQREIGTIAVAMDLSMHFALQLAKARVTASETDGVTSIAHYLTAAFVPLDTANCIFMLIRGVWTPWPISSTTISVSVVVLFTKHIMLTIVSKRAFEDRATWDEDDHTLHLKTVLLVCSSTTLFVAICSIWEAPTGAINGYHPVCVGITLLALFASTHTLYPSINSLYTPASAVFVCCACWLDWAAPACIIGLMFIYCLGCGCNMLLARVAPDAKSLLFRLLYITPAMVHGLVVFNAMLWRPDWIREEAPAMAVLLVDVVVGITASWTVLNAADADGWNDDSLSSVAFELQEPRTNQRQLRASTDGLKPNQIAGGMWCCMWSSPITTGILAASLARQTDGSKFGMACCVHMVVGFTMLALVFPSNFYRAVKKSRLACVVYVTLLDLIPLLYYFAGISQQAKASVVHEERPVSIALVVVFKALIFFGLAIFETMGNKGNKSASPNASWTPKWNDRKNAVWLYAVAQSCLVTFSIVRGLGDADNHASDQTRCVHNVTDVWVGRASIEFLNGTGLTSLQCASKFAMSNVDGLFYLLHLFFFTMFWGEYISQTRGEGHVARRWPDTKLASVLENFWQCVLSAQILYAMLRLRNKMDGLYESYVILDLLFVLILMLTRQVRDGYGALPAFDWAMMFCLETWDVANSLAIAVVLAHERQYATWPLWLADAYVVLCVVTLLTFQISYPFWTSLKRLVWVSWINDFITDCPMFIFMFKYKLYTDSNVATTAFVLNICILSVAVFVWPTKYYATVHLRAASARISGSHASAEGLEASIAADAGGQESGTNYQQVKSNLVPKMAGLATLIALAVLIVSASAGWWVLAFTQQTDGSH